MHSRNDLLPNQRIFAALACAVTLFLPCTLGRLPYGRFHRCQQCSFTILWIFLWLKDFWYRLRSTAVILRVPYSREFLDQFAHFVHKPRFSCLHVFLSRLFGVVHIRAVKTTHITDLPYACPNPVFHQFALQGQDSVSSEVPHKAFAFFSMAFSTYSSPIVALSSLISFSVCS